MRSLLFIALLCGVDALLPAQRPGAGLAQDVGAAGAAALRRREAADRDAALQDGTSLSLVGAVADARAAASTRDALRDIGLAVVLSTVCVVGVAACGSGKADFQSVLSGAGRARLPASVDARTARLAATTSPVASRVLLA